MRVFVWLAIFALCAFPVQGKITDTSVFVDNEQFVLVEKFCFDSQGGELTIEVEPQDEYPDQVIAIYHDVPEEGFEGVYNTEGSCASKLSKAEAIRSTVNSTITQKGGFTWPVQGIIPRWWYVVLANCKVDLEKEGVGLRDIRIEWVNNGDVFHKHFGVHEQGILECLGATFAIVVLMCLIPASVFYCQGKKIDSDMTHLFYSKMLVVLVLHLLSLTFYLVDYNSMAAVGIGSPFMNSLGILVDGLTQIFLVYLYFLISKGVYISCCELTSYRAIYELTVVYAICTLSLLWYEYAYYDPINMYSPYQSAGGYLTIFVRIAYMFFFVGSILNTREQETDYVRRNMYVLLAILGGLWFLSYPIIAFISAGAQTYNRYKYVFCVEQVVYVITYLELIVLFRWNRQHLKVGTRMDKYASPEEYDEGIITDI